MAGRRWALHFLLVVGLFLPCLPWNERRYRGQDDDDDDDGNSISYDDVDAQLWMWKFNKELTILNNRASVANWNYETNMTDDNADKTEEMGKIFMAWAKLEQPKAEKLYKKYNHCLNKPSPCSNTQLAYDLMKIVDSLRVAAPDDPKKRDELLHIGPELTAIYAKATVVIDGKSLQIEPGLTHLMATSRDYDTLLQAWQGWRNETGRKMRKKYLRQVKLQNEGAHTLGLADIGSVKRIADYDMDEDLEKMVDELYVQISPLYKQLHAYVRRKLIEKYPGHGIDPEGPIPAHLLGNMWAQQWNNIYDLVVPYPEIDPIDVTPAMLNQGYDPIKMFKTAEAFYTSIGLDPMTRTFWKKSMIVKPTDGREVVCHASAHDFSVGDDYRIKMCTEVNQEYLKTIHHEMGHIEYYMQYRHLPAVMRAGANAAFHEAIGDTIALSVMTPSHLREIGLLEESDDESSQYKYKQNINALMTMALYKIAFLPFGYLIDKYRWDLYRGKISARDLNTMWWQYRVKYQGISAPVDRTEEDFDAGAKYHVPADTPYMRYFLSFIGQFQFHQALCEEAGHKGALPDCDIYKSRAAGTRLKSALSLGSSKPWPDVMEVLTGQRAFDITALKQYFQPLLSWLEDENKEEKIGWTGELETESKNKKPKEKDTDTKLRELIIDLLKKDLS